MRALALLIGLGTAAVCARLGLWQLDRHAERRAWNRQVEARLDAPPLAVTSGVTAVPADSLAYRRAAATGTFDFAHQTVEPNRTLRGAPGVYVLTPLRLPDGTAVLVNRGWTYAADARTADLALVGEPEAAAVEGILVRPSGRGAVLPDTLPVGYPLLPLVLRRTVAGEGQPEGLAVAPLPPLDAGPHLSYAVQWFVFATIGLVGGVLLALRSGRPLAEGTTLPIGDERGP